MNKYHCVKCNKEKIVASNDNALMIPCCDGANPMKHAVGPAPKKHVPPPVSVKPPTKMAPLNPPVERKVTKLDQPAGDIKIPVVVENKPSPPDKLP